MYGHDARNEGVQTKERERAMESKQRHTTPLRRGAWRYLPGPRVCGSRNGNRSSSILAVASEDRYTLQSVVTVGGPWLIDPRFTLLRTNRRRCSRLSVPFSLFAGNCALLGLRWTSNVDTNIMSILQTAITVPFNGTSRLTSEPRQVSAPIKTPVHYVTITVRS